MRLNQLTPTDVRRAVRIYMELAWPDATRANPWFDPLRLQGLHSLESLLAVFSSSREEARAPEFERYTLRLGNVRYPFMKFVLQEYLVDHEYFFSVDTHDDLGVPENSPDFAGWVELRESNRELKRVVEQAWQAAGIPTHGDLRELAEGLARVERGHQCRGRLLVVDDEQEVAKGLEALLKARGYSVELAFDGPQVLERLRLDPLPQLVLLDYSMPGLDGDEVLVRMRASERLRDVPVLMVTASSIDLKRMQRVSGLLRKPYPRQLLFGMIAQLLGGEQGEASSEA